MVVEQPSLFDEVLSTVKKTATVTVLPKHELLKADSEIIEQIIKVATPQEPSKVRYLKIIGYYDE